MFLLKGFVNFLTVYFRRPKFLVMLGVLVSVVFVMCAVYGMRTVTHLPIYVVDLDNSTASRTIRSFLESSPDLQVIGALSTPEEADGVLRNGEAAAVVFIPDGLSQAVKTQRQGHVFAYIDGTSLIVARNADKAIQTAVKTASVGVAMISLHKKGMPKDALMGALQPIALDVDRPFNAMGVYSEYLLPVLVFFYLNLFVCLMTCAVFQEALPAGIERHVIRRRFFYFGRLLAVFVIAFIAGCFIYQYGLPRVDIVLQSMPLMALSALFVFIVLTQAMYSCINLLIPKNFAMSASYLLCMLSIMLSGLTWPIEMMPWYIQEFVTWIPLTPFLQAVQVFLYHDATWGDLATFGQMFLKQAVLWLCLAFVAMRMKDIVLFFGWLRKRFRAHRNGSERPVPAQTEARENDLNDIPHDGGERRDENTPHEVQAKSAENVPPEVLGKGTEVVGGSEVREDGVSSAESRGGSGVLSPEGEIAAQGEASPTPKNISRGCFFDKKNAPDGAWMTSPQGIRLGADVDDFFGSKKSRATEEGPQSDIEVSATKEA